MRPRSYPVFLFTVLLLSIYRLCFGFRGGRQLVAEVRHLAFSMDFSTSSTNARPSLLAKEKTDAYPRRKHKPEQPSKKSKLEEAPNYVVNKVDGETVRRVQPMVQTMETFAKGRWLGREILEVLSKEFGGYTQEYWLNAFKYGHITINGKQVSPSYRFQNSDRFLHRTHRHEPPVTGDIHLVAETEDFFAVSKPSSMPVHPCGAFRYNSLEYILKYAPLTPTQSSKLHLAYRLDKVTSGLVIFAKNTEAAARISKEIQEKATTSKKYVARVKGRFPDNLLRHLHVLDDAQKVNFGALSDNCDGEEAEEEGGNDDITGKKRSLESCVVGSEDGSATKPPDVTTSSAIITNASSERNSAAWREKKSQRQAVLGKGADISANRTIPDLDSVRQHPAVGYYLDYISAASPDTKEEVFYNVQCPLDVVSRRDGVHACFAPPAGRDSMTRFRLLSYCAESDTSLLEAQPVTGRTHQIRLHCQLLGHPIANDPCYGGELFYGDARKRQLARQAHETLQRRGVIPLTRVLHQVEPSIESAATVATSGASAHSSTVSKDSVGTSMTSTPCHSAAVAEERLPGESDEAFLARTCRYCQAMSHRDEQVTHDEDLEVHLHCDGIWLHAWHYRGIDWAFEAPLPTWASDSIPFDSS